MSTCERLPTCRGGKQKEVYYLDNGVPFPSLFGLNGLDY